MNHPDADVHLALFPEFLERRARISTSSSSTTDVIAEGRDYDPSFTYEVLTGFENPGRIADRLAALGGSTCVLLVLDGRENYRSSVALDEGVRMVSESSGAAAISCIAGELAFCKDAGGRQIILSKRLDAKDVRIRTPFRIAAGLIGGLCLFAAGLELFYPSIGGDGGLSSYVQSGVMAIFGALMIRTGLSGRDEIRRLRWRDETREGRDD